MYMLLKLKKGVIAKKLLTFFYYYKKKKLKKSFNALFIIFN